MRPHQGFRNTHLKEKMSACPMVRNLFFACQHRNESIFFVWMRVYHFFKNCSTQPFTSLFANVSVPFIDFCFSQKVQLKNIVYFLIDFQQRSKTFINQSFVKTLEQLMCNIEKTFEGKPLPSHSFFSIIAPKQAVGTSVN